MHPNATVKRTPFHALHRAAGARLIEFAGFEMPVRYSGDVREHLCVRTAAGLFDVSHMGEFDVQGPGTLEFLNRMVTQDVAALEVGHALYTALCRPDGGIVDDLLVYRRHDRYTLVVNAANVAKDFAWLMEHRPETVRLEDRSDETALLAVQGPKAPEVLAGHVPAEALALRSYRFVEGTLFGVDAVISRTGYTGEDGFELYFDPANAERVWNGLIEAGRPHGLEPVGLGARDTLRLEVAYRLYGNDMTETTSPLEAGIGWTVEWGKGDFVGREALAAQRQQGLRRKLVGFEVAGRRMPRHGMPIEHGGRRVGEVTSGTYAPSLERPIGLGYVDAAHAALDTQLAIVAGETRLPAHVVRTPFYTKGTRRT